MKIKQYMQSLTFNFALICIAMFFLLWLGVFDSTKRIPPSEMGEVETALRTDATQGNADAQNKLGTLLFKRAKKQNGDYSEAINWLEKASVQQHPIAQMNLAFAYKNGHGVPADKEKAITLFHQSGLNYLRVDQPNNAMDSVQNIYKLNGIHPLKQDLINAIYRYEETHN